MARPRYVRYRTFNRLQHSTQFLKWLDEQAERLEVTAEYIFTDLLVAQSMAFEQVEAMGEIPPEPATPTNNSLPVVTGTAEVGATLTVTPGEWDGAPSPTLSYQWYTTDGAIQTEIEGGTDITYAIVEGDVGMMIFVRETATNSEGSDSVDSEPTATVTEPQ